MIAKVEDTEVLLPEQPQAEQTVLGKLFRAAASSTRFVSRCTDLLPLHLIPGVGEVEDVIATAESAVGGFFKVMADVFDGNGRAALTTAEECGRTAFRAVASLPFVQLLDSVTGNKAEEHFVGMGRKVHAKLTGQAPELAQNPDINRMKNITSQVREINPDIARARAAQNDGLALPG